MQGKNSVIHPALNRVPKSEDLQKLLRAVQSGPAPVQQPINLDSGRKFILKVQQARGASGLGKTRTNEPPLWALCEGLHTVWEYNTADIELIFNLVEEAVYTASKSSAPMGGTPAAALAVLGELAAHQPDVFGLPAQTQGQSASQTNLPNGGNQAVSQQFAAPQFASTQTPMQQAANQQAISQQFAGLHVGQLQNPEPQPAPEAVSYANRESQQFGNDSGFNSRASGQFNKAELSPQEMRAKDPRSSQTGMQLSGNLSELGVCELFQSISVAKMTGRLDITSGLESLEVFFEDGAPRRASFRSDSMTGPVRDITGEEVLLEGMTWKTGFFQFNSAMKSSERSPMRRLDLLLLEGATLRDYTDALEKAGLDGESTPVRTGHVSEADFEKALSAGIPVNMQHQKMLYIACDGKANLSDIVRQTELPKSTWLPLMFNLHNCGLIGLPEKAKATATTGDAPKSPLIKEAVQEAFQELLRPDTGLLSYPLFMHFMEVEFQRALRLRLPCSLIIIKVHKEGTGVVEQLSSDDLKLVAERLRNYLEAYDHIGHYEIMDIGILLPHRAAAQAREYANKFIADFNRELGETGNSVRFVWSVGIGCIPEDGIKLSGMVSKAEQERNAAKEASAAHK